MSERIQRYHRQYRRPAPPTQYLNTKTAPSGPPPTIPCPGPKADLLDGAAGNDTINAGAGNDFLIGGTDNDTMNGDAGSDVFIFMGRDSSTIASSNSTPIRSGGQDFPDISAFGIASGTISPTRVTTALMSGPIHLSLSTETSVKQSGWLVSGTRRPLRTPISSSE